MATEGGFFSPGGSSFSTNQSGDGTRVAGFFSKKKEVPTKKFKGIKGITAEKDAINSQTYRDMGDESMADTFKKKYNIDPRDYMNLQSKSFISPSGNEVGQIASATTDLSGLIASGESDFDKDGFNQYMNKFYGIGTEDKRYKNFPGYFKRTLIDSFKDDVKEGYFTPKVKEGAFAPIKKQQLGDFTNKDTKVALGGDNLGGYGALGIAGGIFGLGLKGIQSAIEGGKRLKENIEKRVNPEKNQVSIGDRVGNFLNAITGIQPVAAGTLDANQISQVSERPKLNYVNPDAKTMTMSQIGEAFKPKNLFGYQDKFGRYDDPGSPLAKQRQETMQSVYNRYTRPMTPDSRTIAQIRADQKESMQEAAKLRYQDFKDRRALGPAANIQKTFGADDTYGTNVPSNPAMGFRDKMSSETQAAYDKAARQATAGAQTDASLGNVFTQTYNRIASKFGLPQKSLETVDQRQLRKAQEAYNKPKYQQEAYARKMLGITNDMVKADNMQRMRLNAFARNQAFQNEKALKAALRSAKRLGGNIGTGRDGGFGLGTEGKGLPSNPKGFSGYGVTPENLSRAIRRSSLGTGTGTSTGTGTGRSTSPSRGGISKSTSRGQGGRTGSRGKGGTGSGSSGQGSKSSARGARGSAGARGRGGTGTGGGKSNTGSKRGSRGARKCDIRTKIDIAVLTNPNLVKDDLGSVAYFVQELREK